MSELTLIDGSSYLFRAFHALPPLTNAAGEPTGALLGVVNMLRAIRQADPAHVAFVVDASGPTFRHEMYADYKANRPPMPDDLRVQIEPMLAMVEALGFPILRIKGVEADDVIGTLARQGESAGMDVTISTGDKDFAQLVGPRISLVNTMTRTHMDREGVRDKFGVDPEQIIDYLALVGDKVDNVPGVDKCGPKTAVKWLDKYGSLDAIMAHVGDIKGKIGENLQAALAQLPLSRELVTIRTDVELDKTPGDLAFAAPDVDALRKWYERFEFKAALKDLSSPEQPSPAPAPRDAPGGATGAAAEPVAQRLETDCELVTTTARLDAWLQRLQDASLVSFDTETTSLNSMLARVVGVSLAVEPGHACYIPLAHDYPGVPEQLDQEQVLSALRPLLEDPDRAKLAQNAKYDINVLARAGITVDGVRHDTMLESYVLDATASRHDMDTLAKRLLDHDTIKYTDVAGKGAKQIGFSQVDLDTACRYAAEDADITLRLHHALWPQLEKAGKRLDVYRDIEMPLVPVLARMEQRGVLVDTAALRKQSGELGRAMQKLKEQAHAAAGHEFNPDSPKQLQAILFDELDLPVKVKTPKGAPSTNEEALDAIADEHPLPRLILDYRRLAKLRSTYTEKLADIVNPDTGRVHTSYHQGAVATGRLSSSDPNLQNIPVRTVEGRRIRQAFIAPEGSKVLAADYSQIELRIMAHLSGDEGLLAAFREGRDVHRATAAEVFGEKPDDVTHNQRRAAKAINFGLMYGMSAFGLARNLGIGRGEAADYIERYFARYPGVRDFMDDTRTKAGQDGYVQTLFGRRLYLPDLKARQAGRRAGAERAAINAPMQGTAADIIKRAMLEVDAWLRTRNDAHMLMQVHDELVFEVREDAVDSIRDGVVERMQGAADLDVPLIVDVGVGDNWDQAH